MSTWVWGIWKNKRRAMRGLGRRRSRGIALADDNMGLGGERKSGHIVRVRRHGRRVRRDAAAAAAKSLRSVRLCATPQMAAHQALPSLGFSRQEHWSGLPFPSPMHESEK